MKPAPNWIAFAPALFVVLWATGFVVAGLALGWSVIVLSLAAITLLMLLIRHGDVARVSGLIYLVPAVAAFSTYVVFGETLVPLQILGIAVCAAAVFIVSRRA